MRPSTPAVTGTRREGSRRASPPTRKGTRTSTSAAASNAIPTLHETGTPGEEVSKGLHLRQFLIHEALAAYRSQPEPGALQQADTRPPVRDDGSGPVHEREGDLPHIEARAQLLRRVQQSSQVAR